VRFRVLLWLSVVVACGRSPEPEVAEQPTVEVPAPTEERTETDAEQASEEEASEMPSSRRGQARRSQDDEEEWPLDHHYEPPPPSPFPPPGVGPTGGPDCDALADCCLKLIGAMGSASADPRMCDQLRTQPAALCSQLLPQFYKSASQAGVYCQP
jgi:hypothetical protein